MQVKAKMTDKSAAHSPRRPDLRRPKEFAANFLFYVAVLLVLSFLLGFLPKFFFFHLSVITLGVAAFNFFTDWDYNEGMAFIIERRPYDIGDLIELDPSVDSVSLNGDTSYRVVDFDLDDTQLFPLRYDGYGACASSFSNEMLAKCRITNWSRLPAKIQVSLQVPVDARGGLLGLQEFHEKIKQYASDNPTEWFALDTCIGDAITVGKEYAEYHVELRHRKSWTWPEYQLVLRRKSELVVHCHTHVVKLSNRETAETNGSAPTKVAGGNNEGGRDDCDDNKIDYSEKDTKNTDDQDKGCGNNKEETINNGNYDRRIAYRLSVL